MTLSLPNLSTLSTTDLQGRYLAVFGTPTITRNRPWLIKKLQAATAPEAIASAPADPAAAPAPEPASATPAEAPAPTAPPSTEIEAAAAPSPATDPISEPAEAPLEPTREPTATTPEPATESLALGTIIRRDWRGRTLEVTVVDGGFRLDGTTYRSLSAAATALCGSNRNGLVFFGLKPRPAKKSAGGAP
ncbi:hypothetical protein LBMAG53_23110 [Planctomycetota bacterium]|nr:hypothetical protein LBMAG53_23110 [Planctomycetota bacterium]